MWRTGSRARERITGLRSTDTNIFRIWTPISLYVPFAERSRSSRIGLRDRFTTTARYYVILFLLNGPRAEDEHGEIPGCALDRFHSRYGRRIILREIYMKFFARKID